MKEPLYKHVAFGIVLAVLFFFNWFNVFDAIYDRNWVEAVVGTIVTFSLWLIIMPFKDIFTDKPTLESRRK